MGVLRCVEPIEPEADASGKCNQSDGEKAMHLPAATVSHRFLVNKGLLIS